MGVYGVGIDLVRVDRLRSILDRWGTRFEERVFTPGERATCAERRDPAGCFAIRFAAKEAFLKAIGTGMRAPWRWRDVEVCNNSLGKPEIVLSETAEAHCRSLGIRACHLSLTDDGAYGAALVVLES